MATANEELSRSIALLALYGLPSIIHFGQHELYMRFSLRRGIFVFIVMLFELSIRDWFAKKKLEIYRNLKMSSYILKTRCNAQIKTWNIKNTHQSHLSSFLMTCSQPIRLSIHVIVPFFLWIRVIGTIDYQMYRKNICLCVIIVWKKRGERESTLD